MKKQSIILSLLLVCSLTTITLAQPTSVWTDAGKDYKTGVQLFEQEKFGTAQEKFREAINRIEASGATGDQLTLINAHYYDAVCSKELNRPETEKLFLDMIDRFGETPTTRRAYYQLGDYYFDQKKYSKIIPWFKKVDVTDLDVTEKYEYNFEFGYGYFYTKKFDLAKPYFAEIKDVQNAWYYPANYYYGFIEYKLGDFDEALKSFHVIEKSEVYGKTVPYYIANIDFQEKKYDEVIQYASQFTVDSKVNYFTEIQQLVGKSYFEKGDYTNALPYLNAWYLSAGKATKNDIYQIGFCQYKLKEYKNAIASFKELTVLNDSLGENALYLLGDCYLKTNQKNDARLAFQQAASMEYDAFVKEQASFQFAKLSYELNNHEVAARSLQQFVVDYPSSSNSDEAKELLTLEFLNTNNYRDALDVIRSMSTKSARIREAYQKVAYSRATELIHANDNEGALTVLDESLKNPADAGLQAACYFWKGEIFYEQKKFDEAVKAHDKFQELARLNPKLPPNVSVAHSNYTLGYCYLKQDDYNSADDYFTKVKSSLATSRGEDAKIFADAILRSGDCEFVQKNYDAAISNYNSAINSKSTGAGYALYQKAIILGLQGKSADKLTTLNRIATDYPTSIYLDDALYELGLTQLAIPSYQDAASAFNKIITKYPNSNYASRAHVKLALIDYNLDQDQQALTEYKWVLVHYPKSEEGTQALNGVKEIFTDKGDFEGYKAFLKDIPNVNASDADQDSVMYLSAEKKYSHSDCVNSIKDFSNYINTFPNGSFALNAHFYRAECLYRQNDFQPSLDDYEFVADQSQNRFSEKALLQSARINYVTNKDYAKAYDYYKKLSENAQFKTNFLEAFKGMMYSAFYLDRFDDVANAATEILLLDNATKDDQTEAHFYLAKSTYSKSDWSKAQSEFTTVWKSSSGNSVAESGYYVAEIFFKQNDLKSAEDQSWKVIKQKPSSDYWVAKSFLLLADVYEAQKDFFQAKSTLQSIIAGYKLTDDILPAAKEKLKKVTEEENSQSKILNEQQSEEQQLDSIPENH